MINTILNYLKQASTWKGIFAVATAFGVSLQPEYQEAIITAGLGVIGAIQIFVDKK